MVDPALSRIDVITTHVPLSRIGCEWQLSLCPYDYLQKTRKAVSYAGLKWVDQTDSNRRAIH
ncbi:hypothetical protein GCM10007862_21790 [Dyella lipolytica]|nr:hypothetical protein GCM10007862_21790 [Dyella lipolytica]